MIILLNELKNIPSALFTLINVDIKSTVTSTRLGWMWWVLHPLITASLYYFFVSVIMGRGGDNYHLFVLTGIVSWTFFSNALSGSTNSILRNKNSLMQVSISPAVIVLVPPIVHLFFGCIGIGIVMIWNYTTIGVHSLSILPLLILISLTSYALGLFLAIWTIYLRDTREIIGYVLRAGFFLSPVLYPVTRITESDRIPEIIKFLFAFNPMAWIMTSLRAVMLEGSSYSLQEFFILTLIILVAVQLGLLYLRINSNHAFKRL